MTQHVRPLEGELRMTIGDAVYRLLPGVGLFMEFGDAFEFHNPGGRS